MSAPIYQLIEVGTGKIVSEGGPDALDFFNLNVARSEGTLAIRRINGIDYEEPAPVEKPAAVEKPAPLKVGFSRFTDATSTSAKFHTLEWSKLAAGVAKPAGPLVVTQDASILDAKDRIEEAKKRLPLIKLARFEGDTRKSGSRGPVTIYGVEGDYDGEQVTVAEAFERLEMFDLKALIYTTPRHRPEAPRWRVLVPLTGEALIEHRAALLRRVDAALGTILASESYDPARCYFLGRVEGVTYEHAEVAGSPLPASVSDAEVAEAYDYLPRKKATPAPADGAERPKVSEPGRSDHLYMRGIGLRQAGLLDPDLLRDALLHINEEECDPPLTVEEVESTVAYSIARALMPPKNTAQQSFGPVTDDAAPAMQALPLSQFLDQYAEAPHWVLDHILPKGALYALTAVWGHFKTALALAISKAVAEGAEFNGHATAKGRVLYLCGENPHDVALRLTAMFDGQPVPENFMVFPFPFALDDDKARTGFVESFMGQTFDLVVIDTGPAYTQREEENDNAAAHALAMAFRALIQPLGRPCVLALMHPVKNAGKDNLQPRGGGAFSGSIDGELCAWADTLPNGAKVVEFFHRPKFRGPGFRPMHFAAKPVLLPQFKDNFGRPAETIVLLPEVVSAPRMAKEPRGANAITAWHVINESGERNQKALLKLIAAKLPVPAEGKNDKRGDRAGEALKALQNQHYISLDDGQVQVLVGAGVFTAVA